MLMVVLALALPCEGYIMYTFLHILFAIAWSHCGVISYNILEEKGFILLPFFVFCLCVVMFISQAIILINENLNGE